MQTPPKIVLSAAERAALERLAHGNNRIAIEAWVRDVAALGSPPPPVLATF